LMLSDETANGRGALGGGMHPQLIAGGPRSGVDRIHFGTGADTDLFRSDPFDRVERGDVEQHAAGERYGLAIIAGATGPHCQWHAVTYAGRGDPNYIGLVAWRDDQIGRLVVELIVENRAVPEEIARAPA